MPTRRITYAPVARTNPAESVVDLTSADGTRLKGTFFPAARTGPGVLLLHQCNRERTIWDSLARRRSAAGLNVLTFDLRNFGQSGGRPEDKLTPEEVRAAHAKWPQDIDAAFQYWSRNPA